jgi:hypothetical protein
LPEKPRYINIQGRLIDIETPRVMGILNITPDSFYKSSRYEEEHTIINTARKMFEDGADFLDVVATEATDVPEMGMAVTLDILYASQWANPYVKA